jgi:transitional endoplasmic reticulum ATPase
MTSNDQTIVSLRQAIEVSPDNVPLRLHLADVLRGLSRLEEAQKEYSTALALSPDNQEVKLGLALTFYQLGKYTQALVIAEDLLACSQPPASAHMLYARLLLNDGKSGKAADEYRLAVERDPGLADQSLAERLGVDRDSATKPARERAYAYADGDEDTDDSYNIDDFGVEKVETTFADIGGMEALKEQIRMKIIYPLSNPELYKTYGKKVGGGILMYGPPGCGKTHLARATAGEIKAKFLSVGINEVLDMWIGSSERNLHEFFEKARANAPCVLFFDEVDALAANRTYAVKTSGRQLINQFLSELDGIQANNEGVLILAATNAPWHLDSAFRRPGRFDRVIFVPPPDTVARAEILRIMLKGKPAETVDFDHIAKRTENFSGADFQQLIDQAVEKKIEEALRDGKNKPITTKDLENVLRTLKPTTQEWFSQAKNYALYSNEGGAYDDVKKYMKL